TAQQLLSRKPRTEVAVFCREPDDASTLAELRQKAAQATAIAGRTIGKPPTTAQKKAAREAEKAVDDFLAEVPTITFHLRAIGPKKMEALLAKHPPTQEQIDAHEVERQAENDALAAAGKADRIPALQWNPETFPPALIAKSTTRLVVTGDDGGEVDGSEITADVVTEMVMESEGGWSQQDQAALINICSALNQAGSGIARDLVDRLGKG
ncbi:MAG TPA: hypothetical protein VHK88_19890, partial [Aquihabitans sp.]|nr:hypothetical protein [Aquihabitans sp.]